MITYSGVHIQKIGGAAGIPTPMDIAVQSGRTCRYGGSIWCPLLSHLIFVGLLAYKRSGSISNMIWGFLHDAHEIATSDVPRPFKCDCMRIEQNAIDERLLDKYLPGWSDGYPSVDFDLIEECDHDTCDIEAVELKLPGFAELEIKHTKDYRNRKAIHTDAGDVALFHRIRTGYGGFEVVQGEASAAVIGFANVLTMAESGDIDGVKDWLATWGTI